LSQITGARDRILKSARTLFASVGYEHASTSAIARSAGTSESQLMKYFGSKAGLLETIFLEGWRAIFADARRAAEEQDSPAEKLQAISARVLSAIESDAELKTILLLEGRRVRRQNQSVQLSQGFLDFIGLVDSILADMERQGMLRPGLSPQAVRSALIGMLEGLLRDHLLYEKLGFPAAYSLADMPAMLHLVLQSFLASKSLTRSSAP